MFKIFNNKKFLSLVLSVSTLFSCVPIATAKTPSFEKMKKQVLEKVKPVVSSPKFIVPTAIVGVISAVAMTTHIYNTKLTKPRNPIKNNIEGVTDKRVNETYDTTQDIFSYSPDGKVLDWKKRCRCYNGLHERVVRDENPNSGIYQFDFDKLNSKADEILDKMNKYGCKTDFEKAVFLHDYICDHCKYPIGTTIDILTGDRTNFDTPHSHSSDAYGCLINGKAKCSGIANAYSFLCNRAGIECRYIHGGVGGDGHGWNIIKINGQWYHVDVTFDLSYPLPHSRYRWFMLTEEEISKDHDSFT